MLLSLWIFHHLGICDYFFAIIQFKANGFDSNNEEFFTPKGIILPMNNFYWADVINLQRCLFGTKFVNLIVKLDLDLDFRVFRSTSFLSSHQ